ncbi:hypothetical protein L1887_52061 [Cichorium endivia]|nr:hypothetical protein L1887_52061 [Cichorium endivia]
MVEGRRPRLAIVCLEPSSKLSTRCGVATMNQGELRATSRSKQSRTNTRRALSSCLAARAVRGQGRLGLHERSLAPTVQMRMTYGLPAWHLACLPALPHIASHLGQRLVGTFWGTIGARKAVVEKCEQRLPPSAAQLAVFSAHRKARERSAREGAAM